MKRLLLTSALAALIALPAFAAKGTRPAAMMPPPSSEAQAALKDIETTLGSVPAFFRAMPDAALPAAWEAMKTLQMGQNTALPNKYKELIGLAVAAQIPCHYCVYFHTEAARMDGATDQEIKEAVAMAGSARQWSAILNGAQVPEDTFRTEIDKMVMFVQKAMASKMAPPDTKLTDKDSVLKDMENMFGMVPTFARHVPDEALVGMWKQAKALDFSPNTAIPMKYKDLIGVAVDAQVPCKYCLAFDTAFALKVDGVTQREFDEAVAMAAIVRNWSTVLNGNQVDEASFKRDVDKVFAAARAKMTRPAGPAADKAPKGEKKGEKKGKPETPQKEEKPLKFTPGDY